MAVSPSIGGFVNQVILLVLPYMRKYHSKIIIIEEFTSTESEDLNLIFCDCAVT